MKLKKILIITVPLALLIAAGAGLVLTGKVNLPFLAKKKPEKKPVAGKVAARKPKPTETPKPPPVKKVEPQVTVKAKPAPTSDPDKGVKKVASLWNQMEVEKLQALTADWKEPELARVLSRMETEKVAELLAALPPARASALTRAIQVEAARLPVPTAKA